MYSASRVTRGRLHIFASGRTAIGLPSWFRADRFTATLLFSRAEETIFIYPLIFTALTSAELVTPILWSVGRATFSALTKPPALSVYALNLAKANYYFL